MTSPLIEALAARLSITPDAAAEALAAFVADVRRRVSRDGEAVVPGLGVFRRHVGALVFEPDHRLALAVNHRFAGLAEITVDAEEPAHNYRKTEFVGSHDEDHGAPDEAPADDEDVDEDDAVAGILGAGFAEDAVRSDVEEAGSYAEEPHGEGAPEEAFEEFEEDVYGDHAAAADMPEPEPAYDGDFAAEPSAEPAAEAKPEAYENEPVDEEDYEESSFWEMVPEREHPLGPAPDTFEEADFQVVSPDEPDDAHERPGMAGIYDAAGEPEAADREAGAPEPDDRRTEEPLEDPSGAAATAWAARSVDPAVPDPTVGSATAPIPPPPPGRDVPREPNERGSRLPLIAAAIVVVFAVVAGILLLPGEDELTPALPPADERPPVAAVDTSAVATPGGTAAAAPGAGAPVAETPTAAEPEPVDTAPPASASPLRGGAIAPDAGGYALVVSSWVDAETAEQEAARLSAAGFRSGVLSETVDGVTRYRVAVGQYPTLAAADAARSSEADVLPPGVWVLRIQ